MADGDNALTAAALAARLKLAEQAVAPFEAAYSDLSALWVTLETKAQGATAVAGIFLGATISILTRGPDQLNPTEKTLILAIASLLAAAVILALMAMTPRSVFLITDPEHRFRRIRDLLSLKDDAEFLSLLPDFYVGEEKNQWAKAIDTLTRTASKKARFLYGSQFAIAGAIVVAMLLVTSLLSH